MFTFKIAVGREFFTDWDKGDLIVGDVAMFGSVLPGD